MAALLAGTALLAPGSAVTVAAAPRAPAIVRATHVAAARPHIVWDPIPFPARRRQQMGAYSRRHYGAWAWRLTRPRVIVEHFTDGDSYQGSWNTFASNAVHLGEKPGTCAHFVIDTDGTIYQLVNLRTRCRHAIGLNDRSIGIEHVGRSAAAILANPAMMASSLQLTLWLRARYAIQNRNVIGHAESLMSPYHHERYPSWRCQTHADWQHPYMQIYRARLRARSRAAGVPIGPPPEWVVPTC